MDPEKFLPGEGPFLVAGDPLRDFDPSFPHDELRLGPTSGDLDDLCLFFRKGPCKIMEFGGMGDDVLFLKIQAMNKVLPGSVKINRSGMAFFEGPDSIHGSNGLARFLLKNRERLADGADVHPLMGIAFGRIPEGPALRRPGQSAVLFKRFEMLGEVLSPIFRILQRKRAL